MVLDWPFSAVTSYVTAIGREHAVEAMRAGGEARVARIAIQSVGSPSWATDTVGFTNVLRVLHELRAVLRQAYAVALVTMPTHLLPMTTRRAAERLVDGAVELAAFAGTRLETNAALAEYHGFFRLVRLPAVNAFGPAVPEVSDLVFKLRRHQLLIEKLHLPPDLSIGAPPTATGPQPSAAGLCQPNPTRANPLDF